MLSTKVFVNCKIFKYWIEKNIFFNVSPKNSFLEPNLIQKPTKNQNFHTKKILEWFFHTKIKRIGFWEHIVKYQRTPMFSIHKMWIISLTHTMITLPRKRALLFSIVYSQLTERLVIETICVEMLIISVNGLYFMVLGLLRLTLAFKLQMVFRICFAISKLLDWHP